MTTSEGSTTVRKHARVSSLDQLAFDRMVQSGTKPDSGGTAQKVSKSMFNLRTAASSDEDKKTGKPRGEVVRKRPPSGRKTGIHDGNLYLTRDLESGEEEVVVCNHGNNGTVGQLASTQVRDGGRKSPFPPRLLLVSSKIRNSAMLRSALQQNVVCVQYRYDSSSLEEILSEY